MDAKTAIRNVLATGDMIGMAYLGDLTDAEFMQRPHAKCNHINWQVGHLIVSENQLVGLAWSMPSLPAGSLRSILRRRQRQTTRPSSRPRTS